MRTSCILFVLSVCFVIRLGAQSNDGILMKVGNQQVTVGEFRYIYEKNNGKSADYSSQSLQEYLDLYSRFKLKVAKAREMQLDTVSELKAELEGYRKQLAASYLIDKEVTDFLLKELYDRMKQDVEFRHIFIPVAESAPTAAREEAKKSLREIKAKIEGGVSFEDAAAAYSQDKVTAGKGGYMGFFTAKLPSGFYALESALYDLSAGEVSEVVESRLGYHLVKVLKKRSARGTIEVAHILVNENQKKLADSLYSVLLSGGDFDVLALQYSQDKTTSRNGGKLPPFGINVYDAAFEDAAFSITENGQLSTPVQTKSGWHIIRRLQKPSQDSYEVFVRKMKANINKDSRFEAGRSQLIRDIKIAAGYKEDKAPLQKLLAGLNEEFYTYKWVPDPSLPATIVFSFGGSETYTLADFAAYCRKNTRTRLKYDASKPYQETVDELFLEYVNECALAFEEKNLPVKYPDFRSLMREYEEGILLFEATRIHVWDKANQDTVGLQQFYEREKARYVWPERAHTAKVSLSVESKKEAEKLYKYISDNTLEKAEKKFNKSVVKVTAQWTDIDKGSKEAETIEWRAGFLSPLQCTSDTICKFTKVETLIPSRIKDLSEARGYVVADYQDVLEKEWVASLGKEFQVTIYHEVLQTLEKK